MKDVIKFINHLKENVDEDIIIKKYWIPFINMQLKNIIKGGK